MYQNQQFQNPYMGGTMYPRVRKIEMTQALTPEEEAQLRQQSKSELSFKLSSSEMLSGVCTHKSNTTKMPDISLLGGSKVRCNICHKEFDIMDDLDLFNSALSVVISGLQTMKMWWIDIPPATAREYFPIIPLLEKAPQGLQMAMDCWNSYNNADSVNNVNGYNSFNVWNQMMNGYNPMMGQQPMQQQPYGTYPMMGQQPPMQQDPYQMMGQQPYGTYPMMGQQPPMQQDPYNYYQQQQSNPMVAEQPIHTTFAPNAGGFAPGTTGSMNAMGNQQPQQQGEQKTVTNSVEVKKQMNF